MTIIVQNHFEHDYNIFPYTASVLKRKQMRLTHDKNKMKFKLNILDSFTLEKKLRRNSILKGYLKRKCCSKHFQNEAFQQLKFNFGRIIS